MLKETDAILSSLSPAILASLSFLLVALVGAIDYVSGLEISFSVFYLIPVGFGTWYLSKQFGIFICFVSAATWLAVDYASGHVYSHIAIPFWNSAVRLGFFIVVSALLERLERALEVLSSLAQNDALTGLMNSRAFKQRCSFQLELAARNGRPLALGYIDLDGFKGINDRLGHLAGDQVLVAVADTLAKRLRGSDLGARLGGDEFSILLPDTELAGAEIFFSGLHERLLELASLNHWPIGFSIGVAVFYEPIAGIDEAIQCADALMYKAKNSGKNGVIFEEYGSASLGA